MNAIFLVTLLVAASAPALANPNAIYRCGNAYLNDAAVAQARGCSIVEGGAVTVPGTRVQSPAAPKAMSPRTVSAVSAASTDQRSRDRDALSILQAELGKAQALLAERERELANPQRQALRTADLQSSISRHSSDISSLQREISRLTRPSAPPSAPPLALQSK